MQAILIMPAKFLAVFSKRGEDASALFEPADESFNDVTIAILFLVEPHRSSVSILVGFRRDHRLDPEGQQVRIDPIGAVALVGRQRHRPGDRDALSVDQAIVGALPAACRAPWIRGLVQP